MLLVKYAELTGKDTLLAWNHFGRFETLREVRERAWLHCSGDLMERMYLCFNVVKKHFRKDVELSEIITITKEHGCLRLSVDSVYGAPGLLSVDEVSKGYTDSLEKARALALKKNLREIEVSMLEDLEAPRMAGNAAGIAGGARPSAAQERRQSDRRVGDRRGADRRQGNRRGEAQADLAIWEV
jgi:hypothetical protein